MALQHAQQVRLCQILFAETTSLHPILCDFMTPKCRGAEQPLPRRGTMARNHTLHPITTRYYPNLPTQRKEEAQRRLSGMTQSAKQNASPQALISQLQTEVRELQNRAKGVLVREMEQEQRKLAKLADERFDPQRRYARDPSTPPYIRRRPAAAPPSPSPC